MLRRLANLLSKPPVQTGLVLAGIAAIRAYQPSLIKRSRSDQALIVAASMASGYAAGNLVERAIGLVATPIGGRRTIAAGAIGAASVIAARREVSPPARTAATVTGGAAVASATLALARRLPPTGVVASTAQAVAMGAAVGVAFNRQLRSYPNDGRPTPPAAEVGASLAGGAAIAGGAWGLLAAERGLARLVAGAASSRLGGPRPLWLVGAHAALIGAATMAARVAGGKAMAGLDAAGDLIEPGYAAAPASPLVSGGPGSVAAYARLGVQGRRFVSETTTAASINQVMGIDDAVDPIRAYVGVDTAPDIETRVSVAMDELRRTGAFDRQLLIVGSPSGTGYFNYIPVEAAEYFTQGNVASVAIQYGKRPSLLSIDRVGLAQRQHLALVEAISDEVSRRPPSEQPRVVLYGESLGARTSQDGFARPGFETLAQRSVKNALWVGTPYPTRFRRAVLSANPDDRRFGRAASIDGYDPQTRFSFLDHHEDPVTLFNQSIAWRPPPWLGPPQQRPPHISRTQRWVPAVTFWQTAFDTKNAATVIPGEFKAWGHDYRADLAAFVRSAYAIDGVSDTQLAAVEQALRRSEIERAGKIDRV
jgi:uncharacterized membrane protein